MKGHLITVNEVLYSNPGSHSGFFGAQTHNHHQYHNTLSMMIMMMFDNVQNLLIKHNSTTTPPTPLMELAAAVGMYR